MSIIPHFQKEATVFFIFRRGSASVAFPAGIRYNDCGKDADSDGEDIPCSTKTRQRILQAVHDALAQDGILPSIKELCAQLSITRGTFYLHFSSMMEVRQTLEEDRLRELESALRAFHEDPLNERLLPRTFPYFEWLKRDLHFYRRCSLNDDSALATGLRSMLEQERTFANEAERSFLLYGATGYLRCWLACKERCGAYEAARELDALLLGSGQK